MSPLRIHPTNPRYFCDETGRPVFLTGSHTWANFQDIGEEGAAPFDYHAYLDFLQDHHHNFFRLWVWEQAERAPWTADRIFFSPLPYQRTGPGLANDGKPKFDLDAWNPEYFARLRQRVSLAGERGFYVSIMLFQGWCLNKTGTQHGDPWPYHPYHPANNINGVEVKADGMIDDDEHPTLHSLGNPAVLSRQEAYVKKVIDTVNDLDNVLFEIINEGGSTVWQVHMINLIHAYEAGKPKQHPVGMTHRIGPEQFNEDLFNSPADWISPAQEPQDWLHPGSSYLQNYREDPPASSGRKVILTDTDHLWGHGANHKWAWKSFLRGLQPIFMDPWQPLAGRLERERTQWIWIAGGICKDDPDYPDWEPVRQNLGIIRHYAERINLATMTPHDELASTRYCLANPGEEYLVYLPEGGNVTLNLLGAPGPFTVEWFIPLLSRTLTGVELLAGNRYVVLAAPFTGDVVLYLKKLP